MSQFQIKITDPRLKGYVPEYGSEGAAAVDLRACLPEGQETLTVEPGQTVMVGTGIAICLQDTGVAGIILPRSGLGAKKGVVLGNTAGLIDSDYQGELKMAIWNRTDTAFTIEHGERVAQYMVIPVVRRPFVVVDEFATETERGAGGFGHTGTK